MGHHQDGDTDYSWHCFPVKEEQFIAIQEQDTTERILEHRKEWGWGILFLNTWLLLWRGVKSGETYVAILVTSF